jgi:hypothetical protein
MPIMDGDLAVEYVLSIPSSNFVVILYYILQIGAAVHCNNRVVASYEVKSQTFIPLSKKSQYGKSVYIIDQVIRGLAIL